MRASLGNLTQFDGFVQHTNRVDLIPHQIAIVNEVASRIAPRVLLADEVELGDDRSLFDFASSPTNRTS